MRSAALFCSPVRGLDLRKHGNDLAAGLGVKGSPVQIRPSRLVFRTLVPRIGNENRPTGNDHARPSRKRTPESRAAKPSSRSPRTHHGAPPRGPARQDRWPRRGAARLQNGPPQPTPGTASRWRSPAPAAATAMTPGPNLTVLPFPRRDNGARTPCPPNSPKTCRHTGSTASRRAALSQMGPGRARPLLSRGQLLLIRYAG